MSGVHTISWFSMSGLNTGYHTPLCLVCILDILVLNVRSVYWLSWISMSGLCTGCHRSPCQVCVPDAVATFQVDLGSEVSTRNDSMATVLSQFKTMAPVGLSTASQYFSTASNAKPVHHALLHTTDVVEIRTQASYSLFLQVLWVGSVVKLTL